MSSSLSIAKPLVAVVQEPLARYSPFLHGGVLLQRAQTPELIKSYLRWQYVSHGGITAHTQLCFAPTGWEGYVVGLPPEAQQQLLQAQGEAMLRELRHCSHQAGIPTDRLLAEIAAAAFTPRTAALLEPIFFTTLEHMRAIGQEGFAMQDYSHWRTVYEQEVAQLEQALRTADTNSEMHALANKLITEERLLREKLADITHGRRTAAHIYQTVHQEITTEVTKVMQCTDAPFAVDTQAAQIRYLLPAAPGIDPTDEALLPSNAPEWYIMLHNLPLLGHPLIRTTLENVEEPGFRGFRVLEKR